MVMVVVGVVGGGDSGNGGGGGCGRGGNVMGWRFRPRMVTYAKFSARTFSHA